MSETVRAHLRGTGIVSQLYTQTIDRVRRVAGGYDVFASSGRYFVEQADGKRLQVGLRIMVSYDLVTEESAADGDHADHGWIDPRDERRRSCVLGGKRTFERNQRAARSGRLNWSLRDALAFIDRQCCTHHETCWTGPLGAAGESTLTVYSTDAYQGCDIETIRGSRVVSTSYALHIDGCSEGTADRIARLLANNGVYFANRGDLRKAG